MTGDVLKDWIYQKEFISQIWGIFGANLVLFKESNTHIHAFYSCINVPVSTVYLFNCYYIKYICLYLILITHLYQCIKMYLFLVINFVSMYCVYCNLLHNCITFKFFSFLFYICIMYLIIFFFTIIYLQVFL